jgi:hypothetical protein
MTRRLDALAMGIPPTLKRGKFNVPDKLSYDGLPWLHEQAVPHVQPGPAATAASVAARLAAGETSARFIGDVTEQLDLSEILADYTRRDGRGMAAYHPMMMVRVLLYLDYAPSPVPPTLVA